MKRIAIPMSDEQIERLRLELKNGLKAFLCQPIVSDKHLHVLVMNEKEYKVACKFFKRFLLNKMKKGRINNEPSALD